MLCSGTPVESLCTSSLGTQSLQTSLPMHPNPQTGVLPWRGGRQLTATPTSSSTIILSSLTLRSAVTGLPESGLVLVFQGKTKAVLPGPGTQLVNNLFSPVALLLLKLTGKSSPSRSTKQGSRKPWFTIAIAILYHRCILVGRVFCIECLKHKSICILGY